MDNPIVKSYLTRINIHKFAKNEIKSDKQSLDALLKAHLYNVPFENLDIHQGKKILLDVPTIISKLLKKRGGYCFEAFNWLLKQFGFDVQFIVSFIFRETKEFQTVATHCMNVVKLENESWIVDVGFGDSPIEPLLFQVGLEQKLSDGTQYRYKLESIKLFRISELDSDFYILEKWNINTKTFDIRAKFKKNEYFQSVTDFSEGNEWVQTNPNSRFLQNTIVSIPTEDGYRHTLAGTKYNVTNLRTEEKVTRKIESAEEYWKILSEQFGVELDDAHKLPLDFEKVKHLNEKTWTHL